MKNHFPILLALAFFQPIVSAQNFTGIWKGIYNLDSVTLELKREEAQRWAGTLYDGSQNYVVSASSTGQMLVGTATEKTYGLAFDLKAALSGDMLDVKLVFSGVELPFVLHRKSAKTGVKPSNPTKPTMEQRPNPSAQTTSPVAPNNAQTPVPKMPTLPPNAQHDRNLVGVWKHEEIYNSGYGQSGGYVSNNYLAFNADGTLTDMGGETVVSGSNFSGNTQNAGGGIVPGVKWFSQNKNLYLVATDGTKTEQVKLGRYFIENGAMLITTDSGQKALYYKQ